MNTVMIKCPKTKQLVPTGIELNTAQFLLMEPKPRTLKCPACREVHTWNKQDAVLTDS